VFRRRAYDNTPSVIIDDTAPWSAVESMRVGGRVPGCRHLRTHGMKLFSTSRDDITAQHLSGKDSETLSAERHEASRAQLTADKILARTHDGSFSLLSGMSFGPADPGTNRRLC